MVCLINNGGIENRILIECNRTDLCNNYYVSDTDSDSIAELEEVDGLYYNQFRQSSCFTELKAYKFSYSHLCINCRKIFKIFVLKTLHVVIRFKCEVSDVLFLYDDIEKYPNEIRLCDCFFDCGLQLIKGKKNVHELFSAIECFVITKLITAERVIDFGSEFLFLVAILLV